MRAKFYFTVLISLFFISSNAINSKTQLSAEMMLFFGWYCAVEHGRNSTDETWYWQECYMKGRTRACWDGLEKNRKVLQNHNYTHKQFIGELRTHLLMQKYVLHYNRDMCAVRPRAKQLACRDTRINYFLFRIERERWQKKKKPSSQRLISFCKELIRCVTHPLQLQECPRKLDMLDSFHHYCTIY